MFKQDSTPAHHACATVEYLRQATTEFISPDLCLLTALTITRSIIRLLCVQEHVYQKPICDVDQLKQCLVEVWSDVQQTVVDAAIGEWRKRVRACVRDKGHPFEHLLIFLRCL